jgi:hypothetical protein
MAICVLGIGGAKAWKASFHVVRNVPHNLGSPQIIAM